MIGRQMRDLYERPLFDLWCLYGVYGIQENREKRNLRAAAALEYQVEKL
jgi:hypothetical protein